MPETCTKRSLDWARAKPGAIAWITEYSMSFPEKNKVTGLPTGKTVRMRRDLFNCWDLVYVSPARIGTTYVQTTTRDNQSARIKKVMESPYTGVLLAAGNALEIHGWAKVGGRGQRKLWKVTVTEIKFVNGSMQPVLVEVSEPESNPDLFQVPARDVGEEEPF